MVQSALPTISTGSVRSFQVTRTWKLASWQHLKMLVSYTYPDNLEAATCSVREGVLASNFTKKEALAQVLSCESDEISKNTLFLKHLLETASNNPSEEALYENGQIIRSSIKQENF